MTAQSKKTEQKRLDSCVLALPRRPKNPRKTQKPRLWNRQNQKWRRQHRRQSCKNLRKGPGSPQHKVTWEISDNMVAADLINDNGLNDDFIKTVRPLFPEKPLELSGIEPVDKGSYYEYHFKEAGELLKALDCECSIYQLPENAGRRKFAFRGHRDANWKLEPSIFRETLASSGFERPVNSNRKNRYLAHTGALANQYELAPFVNFLDGMDRLGMFIEPECQQLLQASKLKLGSEGAAFVDVVPYAASTRRFPTPDQFRCLALAQHFGVPTRLLDWTTNPYIALFMATAGISDDWTDNDPKFAVWLMPHTLLRAAQIFKGLNVVDAAKLDNKYIVAQHGFFTSHIPPREDEMGNRIDWPEIAARDRFPYLDEYLMDAGEDQRYQEFLANYNGKPLCFTLGVNNIRPIRRKLDQLNINWGTLMPNLEGVLKEAQRRASLGIGY